MTLWYPEPDPSTIAYVSEPYGDGGVFAALHSPAGTTDPAGATI